MVVREGCPLVSIRKNRYLGQVDKKFIMRIENKKRNRMCMCNMRIRVYRKMLSVLSACPIMKLYFKN